MLFNKSFFDQIANLSEATLISTVAELGAKKDLDSLAIFIAYVKETSLPLLAIRANAQVSTASSAAPGDGLARHGLRDGIGPKGIVEHLMRPLVRAQNTNGATPAAASTTLSDRQLAHLDLVVELAGTMKEHSLWRHAILSSLVKGCNDPAVLDRLPLNDFRIAAKVVSGVRSIPGQNGAGEVTLGSEAMLNGNLDLAAAMFQKMAPAELSGLVERLPQPDPVRAAQVKKLGTAMLTQPESVFKVLDVWTTKAPDQILGMRRDVMNAAIEAGHNMLSTADPAMLLKIAGKTPDRVKAFKESLLHDVAKSEWLVSSIVKNHLVEALPLIEGFVKGHPNVTNARHRLSIADALNAMSVHVKDRAGESRMKATIAYFVANGHDIDWSGGDAHTLKVLATKGNKSDVLRKLHVMLDLGANPKIKDERNYMPASHVGQHMPDQKEGWLSVERSFKARTSGLGLLDQIENEMVPKTGKRTAP